MKKFGILIIILVLIALVGVATCPDRQAHEEAISEVIDNYVKDKNASEATDLLSSFCNSLETKLVRLVMEENLEVENYFVCSIGRIEWEGEEKVVSVGLLGHIFTAKEEQIAAELENFEL